MIGRVVEISTPGTMVRKARGFLDIKPPDEAPESVPLDALEAVILHRGTLTSVAAINALLDCGSTVILCDANEMPAATVVAFKGHHVQSARMDAQVHASQPLKKRLWQAVVQAKVERQHDVLTSISHCATLRSYPARVRSGDPDNVEAQAARVYWRELFGAEFRRGRFVDPVNSILNYGYAVLRAAMARSVVAAGLHPAFALHHRDARNAMALVDDLMEPYRPIVDVVAYDYAVTLHKGLDRDSKAALAALPLTDIMTDAGRSPVRTCMLRTAGSLAQSFESGTCAIWFPENLLSWS
ncbi:MAG: type II CRISPR-associated endonuclease Cas1 [Candidatus Tyrphobacter sp.]